MTAIYEAEFDKSVDETHEQRLQLREQYKKLYDERLEFKHKNWNLVTELGVGADKVEIMPLAVFGYSDNHTQIMYFCRIVAFL